MRRDLDFFFHARCTLSLWKNVSVISFKALYILCSNSIFCRGPFRWIFGYTQHEFSPNYATFLSSKLCHKHFVEGFSILHALPSILNEEEGLGAHTDVIALCPDIGVRFFWCNKHFRPLGIKAPIQCPGCFAIKTVTCSTNVATGEVTARCACSWSIVKVVDTAGTTFPPRGEGWGRSMLYGSDVDYQRLKNLPRDS